MSIHIEASIASPEQVAEELLRLSVDLKSLSRAEDYPLQVSVKKLKPKRSTEQNGLLWMWMEEMAAYFTNMDYPLDKEQAKELMCHLFLGYSEWTTPTGKVIRSLKSTSKLKVGEMHDFLTQVDIWAAGKGCLLTRPEHNVYDELNRRQEQ